MEIKFYRELARTWFLRKTDLLFAPTSEHLATRVSAFGPSIPFSGNRAGWPRFAGSASKLFLHTVRPPKNRISWHSYNVICQKLQSTVLVLRKHDAFFLASSKKIPATGWLTFTNGITDFTESWKNDGINGCIIRNMKICTKYGN